ncbi:hypothetical protein [Tomitella gaofuii]|uniref:hypothetical protein n=1 Tax=Tomitella gaofuii TaxID=2760083 RepID=UPI0015FC2B06|nr:hypothetical protein [Tomitella gaofuii]
MAYTPKLDWKNLPDTSTPVTAADLIRIEQGIADKAEQGPKGDTGPKGDAGPKGDTGAAGADGVSVTGATSDGTNITFTLSDGSTFDVPWPA